MEPRIQERSTADVEFQLKHWLPIVAGVVLAVYAGYWVGNNNWTPLWRLMWIAITVFVAFSLQEDGWVLIPMFWMGVGSIAMMPLPFMWRDVAIMLAFAAYVAHHSMVKTPPISMRQVLFLLLLANFAWTALMWLRKPVGFHVFGSEMMGARIYINIFMAMIAVWVLVRLPQSAQNLSRIPYYVFGGTLIGATANMLIFLLPSLTDLVHSFYAEANPYATLPTEMVRFDAFRFTGTMAVLLIVSHCKPTELLHPVKPFLYLLLVALAGVAISGFRSAIVITFAYIGLSMILRRNWRQLALSAVVSLALVAGLVGGQGRFYSLPLSMQRALCFLPGNWSPVAVQDASASYERFNWWRDIIQYRLIGNWWVGDGLGVRAAEEATVSEISRFNFAEGMYFYGAYHNGPLSTIRCVGGIGLVLLYALMILDIIYARRCLRQCRGTPLEALAMFIVIPVIWFPIHFTLVFGSFEGEMPQIIFQTGLVLLFIRMLNEHPELLTTETASA